MQNEASIKMLNTLIVINNDRIQGYETASNETEDHDLKMLFGQLSQTSEQCKRELVTEVRTLGGTPSEGTNTTGKLYRAWMDLKSVLTGKDRKAILNSCEYGEEVAIDTYATTLSDDDAKALNASQKTMITAQHGMIKSDYEKIKHMGLAIA
jgi:uncharacterized protein (TIGR02284 family)